ncbi:MAG: hypothetical protein LBT74_12270 [Acidobacteriota bacterium]|nr:hypothetical protein [Acidobacteriota bacterium]
MERFLRKTGLALAALALLLAAGCGGGSSSDDKGAQVSPADNNGGGGDNNNDNNTGNGGGATASAATVAVTPTVVPYGQTAAVTATATLPEGEAGDGVELHLVQVAADGTSIDLGLMEYDAATGLYTLTTTIVAPYEKVQYQVTSGTKKLASQTVAVVDKPSGVTESSEKPKAADSDDDGVRDDVQWYVKKAYPADADLAKRAALTQMAVAAQAALDDPGKSDAAIQAIASAQMRAAECLYAVFGGDGADAENAALAAAVIADSESSQWKSDEFDRFFGGKMIRQSGGQPGDGHKDKCDVQ